MRYVISYDLNTPGKDYQTLWDALASIGAQRVLYSQWVVRRYETSAQGLANYLWRFMDANDRLLVISLDNTEWWGMNLMVDPQQI